MNLRFTDDQELLNQTKILVSREKEVTLEILKLLQAIEARKIFLARGYSSMFQFCTNELGYSEGAANRRISSMRLLKVLPEAEEKIMENKVNLSTLTQLHSHIRREEKSHGVKISREEKLELLTQIENKSQDLCQRELLRHSSQPATATEGVRLIGPDMTEYKFIASREQVEKLNSIRDLLAQQKSNLTLGELIDAMADICLTKLNPVGKVSAEEKNNSPAAKRRVEVQDQGKIRYIPKDLKHFIWKRDHGQCQFIDPSTNRKCQSQWAIQYDHIQPFSLGGKTTKENLRLLCRAHNAFRAHEVF